MLNHPICPANALAQVYILYTTKKQRGNFEVNLGIWAPPSASELSLSEHYKYSPFASSTLLQIFEGPDTQS